MTPEERLEEMGLTIPAVPMPLAAYVPGVCVGNWMFISGQLPMQEGELMYAGVVGDDATLDDGYEAAKLCCLNCVGVMSKLLGNLSRVTRIIKVTGYVSATSDFTEHPAVINGASKLLKSVFGDAGQHARAAVGMTSLPKGALVEVEMIVEFE